jgi:hypothetical protein
MQATDADAHPFGKRDPVSQIKNESRLSSVPGASKPSSNKLYL